MPTSHKGFGREFTFIFFCGDLGIPLVHPEGELNIQVPDINDKEVVVACYMQTLSKIVSGGSTS